MKKIPFLVLFLSFSIHVIAQWEVYQNLDFSQPAKDSLTGMAFWRGGDHTKFTTSHHEMVRQNAYLKILGAYEHDQPGYVFQQYEVDVKEYTKIRVSARLKGNGITKGKGAIYCYTKKGEHWLGYKSLDEDNEVKGTTPWKQVNIELWVSPQATTLRIGASMSGEGELSIDDFYLETIPQNNCASDTSQLSFMEECMDLIAEHSLYKNEIDTSALMSSWKRLSACAEDRKTVEDALGTILHSIDNHSFFWSADQVKKWENTSSQPGVDLPLSKGYHIDKHYAYIWMPHFSSGDTATYVLFADHLQNLIDSLDHKDIKGWVFDLRDNQGGNCWPMLAGIGPLLGEGICGYFKTDEAFSSWLYSDGISSIEEEVQSRISRSPYVPHLKNPPVAVLTGPKTASSGEVVAVAFANRPKTMSFGQSTAGYTTGNTNYTLSDGSMLFLAGSIYADRTQKCYPSGLQPDVEIQDDANTEEDEVVTKALEWLKRN